MDKNCNLNGQQQIDLMNGNLSKRRSRIPDKPDISLNLWSILKSFIGKDLTKIPLPVNFNEPLSMLQKYGKLNKGKTLKLKFVSFFLDPLKITNILSFLTRLQTALILLSNSLTLPLSQFLITPPHRNE